jgi:hypothetical protein
VQAGVGEAGLGLDPAAAEHGHAVGEFAGGLEQGGLADAGLAAQDQDSAPAEPGVFEKGGDSSPFGLSTEQHRAPS